jgi:hypothetical protein
VKDLDWGSTLTALVLYVAVLVDANSWQWLVCAVLASVCYLAAWLYWRRCRPRHYPTG